MVFSCGPPEVSSFTSVKDWKALMILTMIWKNSVGLRQGRVMLRSFFQ